MTFEFWQQLRQKGRYVILTFSGVIEAFCVRVRKKKKKKAEKGCQVVDALMQVYEEEEDFHNPFLSKE